MQLIYIISFYAGFLEVDSEVGQRAANWGNKKRKPQQREKLGCDAVRTRPLLTLPPHPHAWLWRWACSAGLQGFGLECSLFIMDAGCFLPASRLSPGGMSKSSCLQPRTISGWAVNPTLSAAEETNKFFDLKGKRGQTWAVHHSSH